MRRNRIVFFGLILTMLAAWLFPLGGSAADENSAQTPQPPSAPYGVTVAAATENSIWLDICEPYDNFSAPDYASLVFHYTVRYGKRGGPVYVKEVPYSGWFTRVVFDGLPAGTIHYFDVFSVNGRGQVSEAFAHVNTPTMGGAATQIPATVTPSRTSGRTPTPSATPAPLEAPRVYATAGDGTVALDMKAGALGGGKFDSFEVSVIGPGTRLNKTTAEEKMELTDLQNGTSYRISVRVRTDAAGNSRSAATTLVRIPSVPEIRPSHKPVTRPYRYTDGTARFVIDAKAADLTGIAIDGKTIAAGLYSVAGDRLGRAEIIINQDALTDLQNGERIVVFTFATGTASTSLRVAR